MGKRNIYITNSWLDEANVNMIHRDFERYWLDYDPLENLNKRK